MRIVFDPDGTLYDSLATALRVDNKVRQKFGYPEVPKKKYVEKFQTKDWKTFYRGLWVKEEHLECMIDSFFNEFNKVEPPKLIPGAKEAVHKAEQVLGAESIYFLTNGPYSNIKKRFERDNLEHYLSNVRNPLEGKKEELYEVAKEDTSLINYTGDLVSDGEECLEARKVQKNIRFYGVIHKQAMNPAKSMKAFVKKTKISQKY